MKLVLCGVKIIQIFKVSVAEDFFLSKLLNVLNQVNVWGKRGLELAERPHFVQKFEGVILLKKRILTQER